MALRPKKQIGTMACLCCGERIPVRQAENGTLNVSCSWCEFPAYAKPGTDAHGHIMKKTDLTPVVVVDEKPAIAAPHELKKPAVARRPNSIFGV